MIEKAIDVISDGLLIVMATIFVFDTIDTQPAVFVQGDPHNVDVPLFHYVDGVVIIRPVKDTIAAHTSEFRAGVRESLQDYRLVGTIVHKTVSFHMDCRTEGVYCKGCCKKVCYGFLHD